METVKKEKHLILFTHNNIEVEYHHDIKTVEVRWIGILDEERFKTIWQKVAEIAGEYQVENILLDATYVEAAGSSAKFASQTPNIFNQNMKMPD
ncbi:MAG: hypothetical protein M3Q05_12465, partial [Bacteroidota bacterium]|nr:hypothetical protein [Bacteroidota bacterium]